MEDKTTEPILKYIHDKLNIIQPKPLNNVSMSEIIDSFDTLFKDIIRISDIVNNFEYLDNYRKRYIEAKNNLTNVFNELETNPATQV